jgi:hypothetical protein
VVSESASPHCRNCDGPLIRRNPLLLFVVGVLMCGSLGVAFFLAWFWVPGIILFLAGGYLVAWATLAGGRWCRNCKTFSV